MSGRLCKDNLINIKHFAKQENIGYKKIRSLVKNDILPHVQENNKVYLDKEGVDKFNFLKDNGLINKRCDYIKKSIGTIDKNDEKKEDNYFRKILSEYQKGKKQESVDSLFLYYRKIGYPHNKLSKEELILEMSKVSRTNLDKILLPNKELQSNYLGLQVANNFHPHMMSVKTKHNRMSPFEAFNNDIKLKDCINRWMEMGKICNPSGMRRILRTRNGIRSVVNFKPAIARFIYDRYTPINGRVLDPCSGYSGRLVGCISANKGLKYHGIDPEEKTAIGNMECASFYNSQFVGVSKMFDFSYSFSLGCAEDIMPKFCDKSFDLCFTSPPYFDLERYSDSLNQSHIRYGNYELWVDKFIKKIILESYMVLNTKGYFVINIKDYKDKPMAEDTINICKNLGFVLKETYNMRL